jgi:hypothetical protein
LPRRSGYAGQKPSGKRTAHKPRERNLERRKAGPEGSTNRAATPQTRTSDRRLQSGSAHSGLFVCPLKFFVGSARTRRRSGREAPGCPLRLRVKRTRLSADR